jgi:hypothetical protein
VPRTSLVGSPGGRLYNSSTTYASSSNCAVAGEALAGIDDTRINLNGVVEVGETVVVSGWAETVVVGIEDEIVFIGVVKFNHINGVSLEVKEASELIKITSIKIPNNIIFSLLDMAG